MKNTRMRKMSKAVLIILLCLIIGVILLINKSANKPNSHPHNDHEIITSGSSTSKVTDTDWKLILVNRWNSVPKNYTVTLKTLRNDFRVDERIYPELQEMFDAARNDGIYPLIVSAYRTTEQQQKLLTDKANAFIVEGHSKREAKKLAETWVALPGTSEHELGLAIDINAEKDKCTNEEVYEWLNNNGYKYGFIMRYPTDKAEITGVNYEPWHYRYVGKDAANEIYNQGICLEEYLDARK